MRQLSNFDGTQETILANVENLHAIHAGVRYVEPLAGGIVDHVLKSFERRNSQRNGNYGPGCFRVAIVLVYMHARGNVDGFGRLNDKIEAGSRSAQYRCRPGTEGEIDIRS